MGTRPITDLFDARTSGGEGYDTLRDFHYRRIDRLHDDEFEIKADEKGIILCHLASPEALQPYLEDRINIQEVVNSSKELPILMRSTYSDYSQYPNYCSRGLRTTKRIDEDLTASTWVDRTGVLEALSTDLIITQEDPPRITTKTLELALTKMVEDYLQNFTSSDSAIFGTVSYLNMNDIKPTGRAREHSIRSSIDTSFIETPVIPIENGDVREQLTPLLRPFWQAAKYGDSPYMTEDGWEIGD